MAEPFSICLVTPSFNAVDTIDETVLSVAMQRGDFSIEYHVQDGGSSDGTIERLRFWESFLNKSDCPITGCRRFRFSYTVQKDRGMYDAINKGFASVRGNIMGWLNADDRLEPSAIQCVVRTLQEFPKFRWLAGRTSIVRQDGVRILEVQARGIYRPFIAAGLYDGLRLNYLQQEGCFWRRSLWEEAGGRIDDSLQYAGDFELWVRFARHAELLSLDILLASFRKHPRQKTSNKGKYDDELALVQDRIATADSVALWDRYTRGEQFLGPVANCRWPDAIWKIEQVSVHQDRAIGKQWPTGRVFGRVIEGGLTPEGPWPAFKIHTVLQWLVGGRSTVSLEAYEEGLYRVTFTMHNYLPNQKIRMVYERGMVGAFDIPDTNGRGLASVSVTVRLKRGPNLFDLYCEKIEISDPLNRPLTVALVAVEAHPITTGQLFEMESQINGR